MKILQLISSEGFYGAESMLVALGDSLRELGCDCILGVFENTHRPSLAVADEARRRGIPVEIIPCHGRIDWSTVQTIRSCIDKHEIEVVHTHGYKSNVYGYVAASSRPLSLVATCHLWTRQTTAVRFYDFIDGLVIRRFDAVVGVSDAIADAIRGLGIPGNKVHRISNGIDFSVLREAEPTLRQQSSSNETIVGTVCRLTEQKGLRYLLEAARSVVAARRAVRFVIVGDGSERPHLEQLAREFGIDGQVTFTGIRRDIANVYASFDMFVLPSIDEGMPMVVLEALAAGKAVIATRVGDVSRLVKHDDTGFLLEPRDPKGLSESIIALLDKPELRRKFASNGRRLVMANYSALTMAQRYLELYQGVRETRLAA